MRFNRRHLNLITQGPGTSALVTVPASQFVRRRPEAEEALDFFLPFGPRSLREEVLPSTVDRAVALSEGEENRAFANQMMRIWQNEMMKVQNDQREALPTYEEVEDKARKITYLRMVGGFTLPANPQFISPYEPYLQALRQMREDDPLGADDRFLEKYGDEFFALTETITESQAAIPPTPEGDELGRKYRDLIVEAPELTSLIIGEEGAGEFSRAVYESQFDEALEAGTGQPIRETQSYEDWVANAERREGWREFSRLMDQVDAIREDWGLPNFMVAEAEPLRRAREAIREDLAQRYPEWHEDYSTPDFRRNHRRRLSLRKIAEHPDFDGRPEIQGLQQYLELRRATVAALQQRRARDGAASLIAGENQDLRNMWETSVHKLTERNPAFADLYWRWLDRDQPEAGDPKMEQLVKTTMREDPA